MCLSLSFFPFSSTVGDPLALKFEIMDESSPFEIFVRELVAMDGTDSAEIVLIDKRGCPTDHFIMGPIYRDDSSAKNLVSHFDAFKFPSSPTVQFRALITPCIPSCEPVQCDDENYGSEARSIASYGRKKRSANESYPLNDDKSQTNSVSSSMMLVQAIEINDKFGFEHKIPQGKSDEAFSKSSETFFFSPADDQITSLCVNGIGMVNVTPRLDLAHGIHISACHWWYSRFDSFLFALIYINFLSLFFIILFCKK